MIKIFGSVTYRGRQYDCNEMLALDSKERYIYGIDWCFNGDLNITECDIHVAINAEHHGYSFGGRNALKRALEYAEDCKILA